MVRWDLEKFYMKTKEADKCVCVCDRQAIDNNMQCEV